MSWSDGYVFEVDYTHGYYHELSPSALSLSALCAGVKARFGRPMRYLELGFGQGLSLNIHAAACQGEFWGTDFNPSQVANARELALASGSGAKIFDHSFVELAERDDLPEFDVIALHGIWSWISLEGRSVVADLIRRKLAVGGLLYISYNCMPGWAADLPLRHLMSTHIALAGTGNRGITDKIDDAIGFAERIASAGAQYFVANPASMQRLEVIKTQNRQYVAHEYFNKDWHPTPFSDVCADLRPAKLDFACASNLLLQMDALTISSEAQQILLGINHPVFRETVRDYFLNTTFRKDIFVKGLRHLPTTEKIEQFMPLRFVLLQTSEEFKMNVPGPNGEISFQEDIYRPLVEMLSENAYEAKLARDLLEDRRWGGKPAATLVQALCMLAGSDQAHIAQPADEVEAASQRCQALNSYICQRARDSDDISFLASPVTGGGIFVDRFEQLFLAGRQKGASLPIEWAKYAWDALAAANQRFVIDGAVMSSPEDNLNELEAQATAFNIKRLPLLKALGCG